MKKKTANIIKGVGVAMAVGSAVAAASASMGQNSKSTKKDRKSTRLNSSHA